MKPLNSSLTQFITLSFILSFSVSAFAINFSHDVHSYGIAMHGKLKYPQNFTHFDYVNPQAPKGGTLKLAEQGTFDSLNDFIAKGNAANIGLIYDSLMISSGDEAFSQYGLVAKSVRYGIDRSWIEYQLRSDARFHDGKKITADDIKFSFELIVEKGHPSYKTQYSDVKSVSVITPERIRFEFKNGNNKELVLLTGQLPILPKHATNSKTFAKTSLNIPLGSGPYKISRIDAGKSLRFERVDNYWAKDLPVNIGRYNFNNIQYDYYRDSTVMLEALKAGEYDVRRENVSRLWATAYTGKAIDEGRLITENIRHSNPQGMQGFAINNRKTKFQDVRVRKALNLAFDFEWTNSSLFYNAYIRTNSYFSNSELAAIDLPSPAELLLLEPLKQHLPPEVFTTAFQNPKTKGNGNNRRQLRQAKKLLLDAGWKVRDGVLKNAQGLAFNFEILIYDTAFERIINPYIKNLAKLGITASIRKVEISQFIHRMRQFDFDLLVSSFGQSLSPGTEQIQYWHSTQADVPASRNLMGIKSIAIDQLIHHVVTAGSREALITASKALDRALLHSYYMVPQWYIDSHRIAYWNKFGRPAIAPKYDATFNGNLMTWWQDADKEKALANAKP